MKTATDATQGMIDLMKGTGYESVTKMKTAFQDLSSEISDVFLKDMQPLINTVTNIVTWFNNLDKGTRDFIITLGVMVTVGLATATAIGAITTAFKLLTIAMTDNPLGLLIVAIATLSAGAIALVGHLTEVNKQIDKMNSAELTTEITNLNKQFDIMSKFTGENTKDLNAFRKVVEDNTKTIEAHKKALDDEYQVAVNKKYNLAEQLKILLKLNEAEKDLAKLTPKPVSPLPTPSYMQSQISDLTKLIDGYNIKIAQNAGNTEAVLLAQKKKSYDEVDKMADDLLKKYKGNADKEKEIHKDMQEAKTKIDEIYFQDEQKEALRTATAIVNVFSKGYAVLATLVSGNEKNEVDKNQKALDDVNSTNQASLASYQKRNDEIVASGGTLTQAQIDQASKLSDAQQKAQDDATANLKKAKQEEWQANHDVSVGTIIMQTAQAIVSALATSGPPWVGIALAGIAGAMGAVELGVAMGQTMPSFAQGGRMPSSGYALVGENGPEIIQANGGYVHTAKESQKMLGGMQIHIGTLQSNDPESFVRGLRNIQRREMGRAIA